MLHDLCLLCNMRGAVGQRACIQSEGATYCREWPQPLGDIFGSREPAWRGLNSISPLRVTKSGRLIVWRQRAKACSQADKELNEAAGDATWEPGDASSGASGDTVDAASDASGLSDISNPVLREHLEWAVGVRLARCAA